MFTIPNAVLTQFAAVLKEKEIPGPDFADYIKWLRYYCDFGKMREKRREKRGKEGHFPIFLFTGFWKAEGLEM